MSVLCLLLTVHSNQGVCPYCLFSSRHSNQEGVYVLTVCLAVVIVKRVFMSLLFV